MDFRCSYSEVATLIALVKVEEIHRVLFSMPGSKAPGPDGYIVEFYKVVWLIVGTDFITAVQSFFLYGLMPKIVNAIILSLAPMTDDVQRITDYRLIAYYNLLYNA